MKPPPITRKRAAVFGESAQVPVIVERPEVDDLVAAEGETTWDGRRWQATPSR